MICEKKLLSIILPHIPQDSQVLSEIVIFGFHMRWLITLLLFSTLISCSKDKMVYDIERPPNCDSLRFTFNEHILPILNANCNFTECHAAGGRGAYDYSQYATVVSRVRTGTIEYRIELPLSDPQHMPEKFNLSACDYFQIKTWIHQGYPEK